MQKVTHWKGDWQVNVRYANNDLFKYNGVIYRVLEEHPSTQMQQQVFQMT